MLKKGIYIFLFLVVFMSFTIGNVQASQIIGKGGAKVEGTDSTKSTVHGTIKDNGAPIPNVLVMIQEKGKSKWIQTRTDASGAFVKRSQGYLISMPECLCRLEIDGVCYLLLDGKSDRKKGETSTC